MTTATPDHDPRDRDQEVGGGPALELGAAAGIPTPTGPGQDAGEEDDDAQAEGLELVLEDLAAGPAVADADDAEADDDRAGAEAWYRSRRLWVACGASLGLGVAGLLAWRRREGSAALEELDGQGEAAEGDDGRLATMGRAAGRAAQAAAEPTQAAIDPDSRLGLALRRMCGCS